MENHRSEKNENPGLESPCISSLRSQGITQKAEQEIQRLVKYGFLVQENKPVDNLEYQFRTYIGELIDQGITNHEEISKRVLSEFGTTPSSQLIREVELEIRRVKARELIRQLIGQGITDYRGLENRVRRGLGTKPSTKLIKEVRRELGVTRQGIGLKVMSFRAKGAEQQEKAIRLFNEAVEMFRNNPQLYGYQVQEQLDQQYDYHLSENRLYEAKRLAKQPVERVRKKPGPKPGSHRPKLGRPPGTVSKTTAAGQKIETLARRIVQQGEILSQMKSGGIKTLTIQDTGEIQVQATVQSTVRLSLRAK